MTNPSAAFLQNARNSDVRFENTTINVAGENVISSQLAGPYGSELQQLLQYCLLGCLVDSKEQYDAPQCEPETRVAMVQQIDDWAQNRDGKSGPLMWLRGGAGAGKSTLAQTIAMKYKREGMHVVTFFFSNRKANRSDGNALILTLVVQLIEVFPAIAPIISQVIKKNPTILSRSPEEHMKHLFMGPLNALDATGPHLLVMVQPYLLQFGLLLIFILQTLLGPILGNLPYGYSIFHVSIEAPEPRPTLIVIDGLDECNDSGIQCKLLHIIATSIPQIHHPLRFLIASRPEAHISRTFEQENVISMLPVRQLDLSAPRGADKDIDRYLRSRFAAIRRSHPFGKYLPKDWPSLYDLHKLIRQSSGHFIYPSTVVGYVDDPTDFPHQRLEEVLDMANQTSTDNPLGPLDALYRHIFSRVKKSHLPVILTFLSVMRISTRGWHLRELDSWKGLDRRTMDKILQLDEGHLDVIIQPLRSLVHIPGYDADESNAQPMRCFHASLFDFLLDPSRSDTLHINLGLAHEAVAIYIIRYVFDKSTEDPYTIFGVFINHCFDAVISTSFLPSYLRKCDYLYQKVFPVKDAHDVGSLLKDFLHLVSRKDVDSTGQLRFEHLQRIGHSVPECSAQISNTEEIGDPTLNTANVIQHFGSHYTQGYNKWDLVCWVFSRWCPNPEASNQDVHPARDMICQCERAIFTFPNESTAKIQTCTIQCGSVSHYFIWGQRHGQSKSSITFLTYDAMGRSFQTDKSAVFENDIVRGAISHLEKCDTLFEMGEDAPWSVHTRRWPPGPAS